MATFNQQNQHVGVQQNADTIQNYGTISHTGEVHSPADLAALLAQLQTAITQAAVDGTLPPATGATVKAIVAEATQQARLAAPDKKSLLDYLTTAKSLIESVAATSALVPALLSAIDAVHTLF